ncbi:hypothetical protein [Roseovarius rhodophyticola]|uniref:D-galactarate dehydratase n=1 Tax=Roseovarius rhodophyticola TaxID=3080827 RepID=A0ABZ2TD67_9RHOB|nr:hypothetical protein [Roseovarius sp. W115]MDV2931417.1 hypothetical protein [Roseovarius sp. W115]
MRHVLLVILSSFILVGCAVLPESWRPAADKSGQAASEDSELPSEAQASGDVAPPADARTVEAFDTTTKQERAAAVAGPSGGEKRLGSTIAALGDVAEPGLWIKTPLVDAPAKGRVLHVPTGSSVAVDLIPLEADAGAGSQLSLAAMRLLQVGLTDLPEVEVYRAGS